MCGRIETVGNGTDVACHDGFRCRNVEIFAMEQENPFVCFEEGIVPHEERSFFGPCGRLGACANEAGRVDGRVEKDGS